MFFFFKINFGSFFVFFMQKMIKQIQTRIEVTKILKETFIASTVNRANKDKRICVMSNKRYHCFR